MILRAMDWHGKSSTEKLHTSAFFLIMGLVFLNPFPHTTFIDQVLFYAALIPMMVLAKNKYEYFYYHSPLFYPFMAFFLWSAVSVFFAMDKPDSAHVLYSHLIRYLIFYLVMINLFNTQKRLITIAICIIFSEVIFAIGKFGYHIILGHDIFNRAVLQTQAIAVNVIPFGFIPAAFLAGWLFKISRNRSHRLLLGGAILILIASTLLTQSRGALLALCISLPILFWNHKRVMGFLFVVIIVILSQTSLKDRITTGNFLNDNPRKYLILYSIEIIKDYPVLGTGFSMNTFRNRDHIDFEKYRAKVPEKYHHQKIRFNGPHNMFLSMGIRTGFVGMVLYAGLFVVSIVTCSKLILYGKNMFIQTHARCCLALLTMFLVNGVLQVVTTHFLDTILFLIFSFVTIIWKINQDTDAVLPVE